MPRRGITLAIAATLGILPITRYTGNFATGRAEASGKQAVGQFRAAQLERYNKKASCGALGIRDLTPTPDAICFTADCEIWHGSKSSPDIAHSGTRLAVQVFLPGDHSPMSRDGNGLRVVEEEPITTWTSKPVWIKQGTLYQEAVKVKIPILSGEYRLWVELQAVDANGDLLSELEGHFLPVRVL
jgi:hypothetical protein